jgi:hypothetical protein
MPAFIAQLLEENVEPAVIERAVGRVNSLQLGESITGNDPLQRAFAFEQAKLMERTN